MIVDLFVQGSEFKTAKVAFSRQSSYDVHCRAEVQNAASLDGVLSMQDGRTLTAFDVYVFAKIRKPGFQFVTDCDE
jgi:hypothetical protein